MILIYLIIYKSKTGFTEKYAKTLAQELNCEVINLKDIDKDKLGEVDIVIYGSRVHAGIIDGLKQMKEMFLTKHIKKLVIFATGGTPNDASTLIDNIWKSNLKDNEMKTIPHFYLQSGICYEKMGLIDRTIMKFASSMMKKKKNKDDNEQGFVLAVDNSYDISSDEYLKPLISFIKNKKL